MLQANDEDGSGDENSGDDRGGGEGTSGSQSRSNYSGKGKGKGKKSTTSGDTRMDALMDKVLASQNSPTELLANKVKY